MALAVLLAVIGSNWSASLMLPVFISATGLATKALMLSVCGAPGLTAPFAYKGAGGYPGTGGSCGAMLAAGEWCQVVIVFAPQAVGTHTRTLAIGYSDTMLPALTATHTITGTGQ